MKSLKTVELASPALPEQENSPAYFLFIYSFKKKAISEQILNGGYVCLGTTTDYFELQSRFKNAFVFAIYHSRSYWGRRVSIRVHLKLVENRGYSQ